MGVTKPKLPYVRAPQTMLPGPLKIFSVLFGRKILLLEKKIVLGKHGILRTCVILRLTLWTNISDL